ncbi:MAG: DUF1990 family protein [Anaerolineales bacterium]|nr:DUF1990 family protein [Anaerolineales bacterium]
MGFGFLIRAVSFIQNLTLVAFAYGALTGHVESGEERFAIHFDPTTEKVTYEIIAFSRPAVLLTKLGYPWVRRIQQAICHFFGRGTCPSLSITTLRHCPRNVRVTCPKTFGLPEVRYNLSHSRPIDRSLHFGD